MRVAVVMLASNVCHEFFTADFADERGSSYQFNASAAAKSLNHALQEGTMIRENCVDPRRGSFRSRLGCRLLRWPRAGTSSIRRILSLLGSGCRLTAGPGSLLSARPEFVL